MASGAAGGPSIWKGKPGDAAPIQSRLGEIGAWVGAPPWWCGKGAMGAQISPGQEPRWGAWGYHRAGVSSMLGFVAREDPGQPDAVSEIGGSCGIKRGQP